MMVGTVLLVMVKSLDSGVEQSNRGEGFEGDDNHDKDSMKVTTLHLSKLALLTQGGTVPDVEAALERHCSQLVDLVRIPFVTI